VRTIALIPARSGSRGIPNKNLRLLGGKPLIEWTIDTALQVGGLDRLVVSAGNEEIAVTAIRAGAEAFVRPEELNGDMAPMIDVVKDAIEYLGLKDEDIIVLLQPTAPFRSVESVQRCIQGFLGTDINSCMAVLRVPDRFHPDQITADLRHPMDVAHGKPRFPVNRQDLEPTYVRAGTVYAFYVETARKHGDIYGKSCLEIEIPESEALNLDEMADWYEAERRVQEDRATKAARTPSVQSQEQAQPAAL